MLVCVTYHQEYAAQALRNLAIDNADNAGAIMAVEGLPALVQLLGLLAPTKVQEQASQILNVAIASPCNCM